MIKNDLNKTANPLTVPSFTGTLAPGVHVVGGMGNALSVETEAGIVQIDTGPSRKKSMEMIASLRELTDAPVHAIAASHGHLGYNSGTPAWIDDAKRRGDPPPRLIGHANLVRRWKRYQETAPLQMLFAELQFRAPVGTFPTKLPITMPTETFEDSLRIGHVELQWAPSETDDAIVLWIPEQKLLYGGAAITPSIPNVGTPLRSLRDPVRWAETLDRLADLEPEIVVMEFGPPIEGKERIGEILRETSRALHWVRDQVVVRMNAGFSIEEILHDLDYPAELFDQPWMSPLYGAPDYIARDVYRAETGWWDRNATNLHPAAPNAAAAAVASAIVDKQAVIARARELAAAGDAQLAMHVIDVLALVPFEDARDDPDLAEARELKAELCRTRAGQATSFVSQSLYVSASRIIGKGAPKPTGVR